ncbi:hypothetical protein [Gottfriedia acidiceleris]|uniref:hypothetical protein n=1 Tax=Gottfriedia acidiceleris TaxID=371036 RepID=UPI002FFF043D
MRNLSFGEKASESDLYVDENDDSTRFYILTNLINDEWDLDYNILVKDGNYNFEDTPFGDDEVRLTKGFIKRDGDTFSINGKELKADIPSELDTYSDKDIINSNNNFLYEQSSDWTHSDYNIEYVFDINNNKPIFKDGQPVKLEVGEKFSMAFDENGNVYVLTHEGTGTVGLTVYDKTLNQISDTTYIPVKESANVGMASGKNGVSIYDIYEYELKDYIEKIDITAPKSFEMTGAEQHIIDKSI